MASIPPEGAQMSFKQLVALGTASVLTLGMLTACDDDDDDDNPGGGTSTTIAGTVTSDVTGDTTVTTP